MHERLQIVALAVVSAAGLCRRHALKDGRRHPAPQLKVDGHGLRSFARPCFPGWTGSAIASAMHRADRSSHGAHGSRHPERGRPSPRRLCAAACRAAPGTGRSARRGQINSTRDRNTKVKGKVSWADQHLLWCLRRFAKLAAFDVPGVLLEQGITQPRPKTPGLREA
jgi:hypothetical protein